MYRLSGRDAATEALPSYLSFLAGGMAGVSASAATYPLDLARGRITGKLAGADKKKHYSGIINTVVITAKEEGFAALYKGPTNDSPELTIRARDLFHYIDDEVSAADWPPSDLLERVADERKRIAIVAVNCAGVPLADNWANSLLICCCNDHERTCRCISIHVCARKVVRSVQSNTTRPSSMRRRIAVGLANDRLSTRQTKRPRLRGRRSRRGRCRLPGNPRAG